MDDPWHSCCYFWSCRQSHSLRLLERRRCWRAGRTQDVQRLHLPRWRKALHRWRGIHHSERKSQVCQQSLLVKTNNPHNETLFPYKCAAKPPSVVFFVTRSTTKENSWRAKIQTTTTPNCIQSCTVKATNTSKVPTRSQSHLSTLVLYCRWLHIKSKCVLIF